MRILKKDMGEKGITLIELAVVMAIVAIMGLLITPSIVQWLDNFRIRQAARAVSSDLQFAKMKAISTGIHYTAVFNQSVGGTTYSYVIFPDYNNNMVLDNVNIGDIDDDGDQENETTDILKSVLFERNISFDTAQSGGIDFPAVSGHPAVAFNRSGLPIEQSGPVTTDRHIFLLNTKNNKHLEVTVSPCGRVGINEY